MELTKEQIEQAKKLWAGQARFLFTDDFVIKLATMLQYAPAAPQLSGDVVEAMLRPMTDEEYKDWPRMERMVNCWDELNDRQKVDVFVLNRRNFLLKPAEPPFYCVDREAHVASKCSIQCLGCAILDLRRTSEISHTKERS